ncbi:hypothetical protein BU23DRAFT_113129 [Bimuria novae-zelandiae CBS 107.79]|uniref:Uncharacterized protein n=1 Tax=Bimuria novae-zelandiae CBS 107.79 TaxID=1447943 RepID=A0A6A5VLG9_9PLEO|nr:hypothetical protein BU23DRAFT_113129 [Bimuria novae-zelandiae CBS 107.79]
MFSHTLLSALATALLLTTTSALPSRTHCRCTITSTEPSRPSTYHDSLANPDTLIPFTTPSSPPDLCAALGTSLENLRHTNPALYESYVTKSDERAVADATAAQKPLSTTILLRMAAAQGFQNLGFVLPSVDARKEEEERPRERIECRSEEADAEAWAAYQFSWVTLVVLRMAVALVVVACMAEGAVLGWRWLSSRARNSVDVLPAHPSSLRLSGEEKRLFAAPLVDWTEMRSPGVEKKMHVYASPLWKSQRFSYVEDEDDEFNRPVM